MSLSALENEVHVWFCRPDEITDTVKLDEYHSILSAEESERLEKIHFAKDQHAYLVSHALVKKVLSMYCDVTPEQWLFTTNQHGKPEISPELDCPSIKFNLSHTDGLSACIVSLDNACGVDVENIQRKNKLLPIAERMFAESELETMRGLAGDLMRNKFFDYWTLREAYVKALGTGLSGSSKQFYFDVTEQSDVEKMAEICFVETDKGKDKKPAGFWQFSLLRPSGEHVCAVAIQRDSAVTKTLVCRRMLS